MCLCSEIRLDQQIAARQTHRTKVKTAVKYQQGARCGRGRTDRTGELTKCIHENSQRCVSAQTADRAVLDS
jgi:hypothetical protein